MSSEASLQIPTVQNKPLRAKPETLAPVSSHSGQVARRRRAAQPGIALGVDIVQAKLAVGPADDPYEREADVMAERVVRALRSGDANSRGVPAGSTRLLADGGATETLDGAVTPMRRRPTEGARILGQIDRSMDLIQRDDRVASVNAVDVVATDDRMKIAKEEYLAQKELRRQGGSETQTKPDDWQASDGKWYPIELAAANDKANESRSQGAELRLVNEKRSGRAAIRHDALNSATSSPESDDSVKQTVLDSVSSTVGLTAGASDLALGDEGTVPLVGGLLANQAEGGSSVGVGAPEGEHSVLVNGNGPLAGGHNIAEGGLGAAGAGMTLMNKDAATEERVVAGANTAGFGLKAASGVAGTTEGLLPKDSGKANDAGEAGRIIGQGADTFLSAGQLGGTVLDVRDVVGAVNNDALTTGEKVLEVGSKSASAGSNASTSAASGMKVAGYNAKEGGGHAFKLAEEIAVATAVASVFSIVAGAFDIAAGLYATKKAWSQTKELKVARDELIVGLRAVRAIDVVGKSALEISEIERLDTAITDNLAIVGNLIGMKTEASSQGKKQAVGGLATAVGGVATLTGLGLPIVLTIAVAGALLKLGFVGAQMRRNSKTSKWIKLAKYLNDKGELLDSPADEDIGFPEMKDRFLKAYYAAPLDRDAGGLKTKNPALGHAVRQFGRSMKWKEIGKPRDVEGGNVKKMSDLKPKEYSLYWLKDDNGELEKSTGKAYDVFKWDVTRSKHARSAAKSEVVEVLNHVAYNTFQSEPPRFETGLHVAQMEELTVEDHDDLGPGEEARLNTLTDDVMLSTTGLKGRAKEYGKRLGGPPLTKQEDKKSQDDMKSYVEKFVK